MCVYIISNVKTLEFGKRVVRVAVFIATISGSSSNSSFRSQAISGPIGFFLAVSTMFQPLLSGWTSNMSILPTFYKKNVTRVDVPVLSCSV